MLYLYNPQAGSSFITLDGEDHRYLFKVRRHKADERIYLRNLNDDTLYSYHITSIDKHIATLTLQESQLLKIQAKKSLHIGLCVIDPKSIEKALPTLNELGVEQITFIHCDRSQKSFKLDFTRWEKILRTSSQQCGRSNIMKMQTTESLKIFLTQNPQSYLLNFSPYTISQESQINTIVIGCEGGFTSKEIALFETDKIIGLDTPLVLKSESAICAVGSKILV